MNVHGVLLVALVALPALAAAIQGAILWSGSQASEELFARITGVTFAASAIAAVVAGVLLAYGEDQAIVASVGTWFEVGHYAFRWELVGDELSLLFSLFCAVLVGVIGVFSRRYLHRETGYFRFYFLLALFGAGVQLVVLGASLDLVFYGWEIVGVTSALLIAFFHERRKPVEHGLRAFITYRFCDVGLLAAAVWMHHVVGSSTFVNAARTVPWRGVQVPTSPTYAMLIGLLLLWASMGKAAQAPFGGWLPRAMEGPTPSSAIFYGAISVHLGPYLLLRAAPLIENSAVVMWCVIVVGTLTAFHGTFVGRAQTDIKSALAYASMTQVGVIFVEIGLGFRYIALAHIVGHAALRTLQILRSPSLLHDHHHLEQAVGAVLPKTGGHLERLIPKRVQPWLYRHALERGYFDAILRDRVVGVFVRLMRGVDAVDRRWTHWLVGVGAPSTERKHAAEKAKEVAS